MAARAGIGSRRASYMRFRIEDLVVTNFILQAGRGFLFGNKLYVPARREFYQRWPGSNRQRGYHQPSIEPAGAIRSILAFLTAMKLRTEAPVKSI